MLTRNISNCYNFFCQKVALVNWIEMGSKKETLEKTKKVDSIPLRSLAEQRSYSVTLTPALTP